jgi:DNA-binding beta-propeller fold protein YncE
VRLFSGQDFAALGTIPLGTDADNVRIDSGAHRVYVGYGNGALAVIDPVSRKRVADIPLAGHPESFQLDPAGPNVFVNIPGAKQIVVVSRDTGRAVASWPTGRLRSNYPLALDEAKNRLLSVFREPAHLQAYDARSGEAQVGFDVCEDSDDVFVDARRRRVYVICGDGYIDVLDASGNTFAAVKRVTTSAGSRTGLFLPDSDRLLVAVRAAHGQPAAVWIYRVSGPFGTK